MKLQTMVTVGLLAIVAVVVTVATGGSSSTRLPRPESVMRTHGSTASSAGSDRANSSGGSSTSADQVYATPSSPALSGCTVGVSNPAPPRGQTAETATVTTTAGADVRLEADYVRTRSVHSAIADGSGHAYFDLAISHAAAGVTVHVTATVSLRGLKDSCSTSFTPVYAAGVAPAAGG